MTKMNDRPMPGSQRGAVLILAMIFMLMVAIVAGTVTQTSILELFMAGNEQAREEAFQQAQGILTEVSGDIDNFPVAGEVGFTVCPSSAECAKAETTCPATCDSRFDTDPTTLATVPAGTVKSLTVVRRGPKIVESLPFRQAEDKVSGVSSFDAALFESSVEVDGSAVRLGSASVVQGMAVRIVASGQKSGISGG